jgi:SAM-dependent methyltransferase
MNSHRTLWRNYSDWALERGHLVVELLGAHLQMEGAKVLDAGCGSGGTSLALAEAGARVTAVDMAPEPPERFKDQKLPVRYVAADLAIWHSDSPADAAVLWDVLEHLPDPNQVLGQLHRSLSLGGVLLIATPNRWAPSNALCDPHYSLPLLSLLRRPAVRRIVGAWLNWHRRDKPDFPQLLSLGEISSLLHNSGFSWRFIHHAAFAAAMRNPQSLWNRPWHRRLFRAIKARGWDHNLERLLSDSPGFRNRWLMPTFFILAKREARP